MAGQRKLELELSVGTGAGLRWLRGRTEAEAVPTSSKANFTKLPGEIA